MTPSRSQPRSVLLEIMQTPVGPRSIKFDAKNFEFVRKDLRKNDNHCYRNFRRNVSEFLRLERCKSVQSWQELEKFCNMKT